MTNDPLLTTLLDLDAAMPHPPLIVGGGYGLFLKQLHLEAHREIGTLFPRDGWPAARSTKDIDLILRAEIVTDSDSMKGIRSTLDALGFKVIETAKFTQFNRPTDRGDVKIDLLAAPLGAYADRVPKDRRRVKPRPRVDLHASKLEEALGVDRHAIAVPIEGRTTTGIERRTEILVPQGFSYLLMKLYAFRDRQNDADKSHGQHHALDAYRIVAMLTAEEYDDVRRLAKEFAGHDMVNEARRIVAENFAAPDGVGRLRIREHPSRLAATDLDRFARELAEVFDIGRT